MRPARHRSAAALVALLLAILVTGCGSSGGDQGSGAAAGSGTAGSASSPVTAVTIVSPDISFSITKVFVPVGKPVTLTYDNRNTGVPHNLHVQGSVDQETPIRPGPETETLTVTFPTKGSYPYQCDVHPQQMKGTIEAV